MKKILFAASECVPFVKTGGLADVVGSLPAYYNKDEFDVRVILPKYTFIPEKYTGQMESVTHFYMKYMERDCYVGIMTLTYEGIQYYFIDNEDYYSGNAPYTDAYYDLEKFAFFSNAVLSALPVIGFKPDIIHCHDWQTGLIPVYLKDHYAGDEFYRDIKSVMTIHNLKFQGVWSIDAIKKLSMLSDYYFTYDKLEAYGNGNMLKGGLVYADRVTTVSKTYVEEIKTPEYGEGLHGLMQARSNDLVGIVNGLDYRVYDPENDELIPQTYGVENFRKLKKNNKTALQGKLGLKVDPKVMMIGIVSRLTDQKGFDLINAVMEDLCGDNIQLVILGTGEKRYEDMFSYYAAKFPEKVSANILYAESLSHEIYAACDAFLMPSRFEPCGLSQLMSLRYGTVPIVRETGGLNDTVEPYNEYTHTGTGFSFEHYNAHDMLHVIRYAESVFYDKKREWNRIAERAMQADFSWNRSAREYEELYLEMLEA